ncbi:MAG: hypothetical protein ACRCZ9_02410 [Fusobacteriaceae bacterium]
MEYSKLDLSIYTKNEKETFEYIIEILESKGINFSTNGLNIYSICHFGKPCFCAHLDTVCDEDMKKPLMLDKASNTLFRDNGILGADDKAGISIILNHVESLNFAFFHSEEMGGIGAFEMIADQTFKNTLVNACVPCFVEYDRMGSSDLIGVDNNYCQSDLAYDIASVTHYKQEVGVFTDINILSKILPGVNLSCGYYLQHTTNEYLNLDDFELANSTVLAINDHLSDKQYRMPKQKDCSYLANNNESEIILDTEFTEEEIEYLVNVKFISKEDIYHYGRDYLLGFGLLDDFIYGF